MKISLAYSPDSDDAFMIFALKEKLVSHPDFDFEFYSDDIQQLNQAAEIGRYDISAISMAAFADLSDEYALLPVGASVGQNFGPVIVCRNESAIQSPEDLEGRTIAIPGLKTSAYFAARILLPNFDAKPLPFDKIGPAILSGSVDAGILIHELQLNYADHGLKRISDLGILWHKRYQMPLPLGGICIRRSLGQENIKRLSRLYQASIQWALDHRKQIVAVASQQAIEGLPMELAERYIAMYVNEDSLDISDDVKNAGVFLCKEAAKLGLCRDISDFGPLFS